MSSPDATAGSDLHVPRREIFRFSGDRFAGTVIGVLAAGLAVAAVIFNKPNDSEAVAQNQASAMAEAISERMLDVGNEIRGYGVDRTATSPKEALKSGEVVWHATFYPKESVDELALTGQPDTNGEIDPNNITALAITSGSNSVHIEKIDGKWRRVAPGQPRESIDRDTAATLDSYREVADSITAATELLQEVAAHSGHIQSPSTLNTGRPGGGGLD